MTEQTNNRRPKHDGRTTFIAVLAGLLIIGGLRIASIEKASSTNQGTDQIPTPVASSAEACDTWAGYWSVDSGVHASKSALEGMSNCRLAEDGHWIVPESADDTRLANAPILTPEEKAQTHELRAAILAQVDGLESKFPNGLKEQIATIYDDYERPVIGHLKDTRPISSTRSRYNKLTQSYLMRPDTIELANYVGWWMARKQAAFDDFLRSCERKELQYLWVACRGMGDNLSVNFPPWPWEVTNSYNLDSYLKWALDNGKVPPPTRGTPESSS
jgi:hypothetical protein